MHDIKRRLAAISNRISNQPVWRWLGPLSPLAVFAAFFLLLFALGRVALVWDHWSQVGATQDLWRGLLSGARVDAIVIADVLIIPTLILFAAPNPSARGLRTALAVYFAAFGALFIFLEIATWPFMAEFQSRPNHLLFQYLDHPAEVFGMVLKNFALVSLLGALAVAFATYVLYRAMHAVVARTATWHWRWRSLGLPLTLGVLFIAARSGLGEANANPSLAAFSNNYLANQVALNATYSVAFAAWLQHDDPLEVRKRHGDLPRADILARIRADMGVEKDAYTDALRPTLHRQSAHETTLRDPNIVIIVEESFGARMIGTLGGKPVSPYFDKLTTEGAFFRRLYATGERTYRGLEAVTTGYLPIDHATTVLRQPDSQRNFFTLAALLKKHRYFSTFIYGGEGHFDNMSAFFLNNGFDRVIDQHDFTNPVYKGTWGVSDEDLFAKLDETLSAAAPGNPAFITALTLSNHRPFDFPDGRIDLFEQPKNTTFNSAKYADYALGKFFEIARAKPYFKNTLFLIVADHQWKTEDDPVFPLQAFHIPALLIGPRVSPRAIDTLASQIDLPVTLLGAAGFETQHPMIGRDLLHDARPGRALLEHNDTFAFWRGDDVMILPAYQAPRQYRSSATGLSPIGLDQAFHADALAHVLISDLMYREKVYNLPPHTDDACERN